MKKQLTGLGIATNCEHSEMGVCQWEWLKQFYYEKMTFRTFTFFNESSSERWWIFANFAAVLPLTAGCEMNT